MILLLDMPGSTEWMLILMVLAIGVVPYIFFLLTLQNTLNAISYENRKMPPANVWLMFIPVFNIIWQFIMVSRIAESIGDECALLNIPVNERNPSYNNGLVWNICTF